MEKAGRRYRILEGGHVMFVVDVLVKLSSVPTVGNGCMMKASKSFVCVEYVQINQLLLIGPARYG